MSKKAIIVGCNGQDGRLMTAAMEKQGYSIIGIDKENIQVQGLSWDKKIDITKRESVFELIKTIKPDLVYYFSAFHHSSQDAPIDELALLELSYQVNYFGYLYFLDAIRKFSPHSKIFYACSSMIFGDSTEQVQTENSAYKPDNAYAITKLDGLLAAKIYRQKYNVFAPVGILYNHESVYRPDKFVMMKIISGAIDIKNGLRDSLVLGDLGAQIDVGYAGDFIEAMQKIMQLQQADEFIISTNALHSIQEIVEVAFEYLGLDWQKYVKQDQSILGRTRKPLQGDYSKLKEITSWQPKTPFKEMVELIVKEKLNN